MKGINNWKLDRGWRNAPFISETLLKIYQASSLYNENSSLQRLNIYEYIGKLSPDEPRYQWALFKEAIFANPFDIYHIFKKAHKIKEAIKTNLGWTLNVEGQLVLALIWGLFLTAFYCAFVLMIKYFTHLIFYVRRFVRFPVNKTLATLLIVVVLMLPVYFNFGFIWLPLFCMVLMWLILSRWEKVAVFFLVVLFLFLSLGIQDIGKIFTAVTNRDANLLYLANYSQLEPGALRYLKKEASRPDSDPDILFTLGLLAKRRGDYKKAVAYYLAAIRKNTAFAVCMNNLANVYMLSNGLTADKVAKARSWYKKAIKVNPSRAEFFYNLSKSYPLLQVEGMEYIVKARDLNPLLIDTLTRQSSNSPNQRLVDCLLPVKRIWRRAFTVRVDAERFSRLFGRFFLNSPWDSFWIMPVLLLMWIGVFLIVQRRVDLAVPCEQCGQLFFRPIQIHYSRRLCHQCQMIRKRPEQADPQLVKQKEMEISKYRRRKKGVAFFIGISPSGGGFFLMDQALVGAILAFLFYFLFSYFFISHQVLPVLALWFYGYASPSVAALVLAVLVYLVGLIPTIRAFLRGEI